MQDLLADFACTVLAFEYNAESRSSHFDMTAKAIYQCPVHDAFKQATVLPILLAMLSSWR